MHVYDTTSKAIARHLGLASDREGMICRIHEAAGLTERDLDAVISGDTFLDLDTLRNVAKGAEVYVGQLACKAAMICRDASGMGDRKIEEGLVFVASTAEPDRYDDIVGQHWDLAQFATNPVAPWGHDYSEPPVGRWEDVGVVDGALMGRLFFHDVPANPRGQQVASGYRGRFLSAVSVGFQAGKMTRRSTLPRESPLFSEGHGWIYGDSVDPNRLLEISPVTIPANPSATARAGDAALARAVKRAAQETLAGTLPSQVRAYLESEEGRALIRSLAIQTPQALDLSFLMVPTTPAKVTDLF